MLLPRLLPVFLAFCISSASSASGSIFGAGRYGIPLLAVVAAETATAAENHLLPEQPPATDPDDSNQLVEIDGFYFENPSLNCTYASQPYIYKAFSNLDRDVESLVGLIHPNVSFTVVGHHPLAGRYHDLKHFYINALYRLFNCARLTYPERYKSRLQYIHGGCDQQWSVQEVYFEGRANNGEDYSLVNVWITRWDDGKMVEVRTYVDAAMMSRILYDNEIWSNSTTDTEHYDFLPGPRGMPPDMKVLEDEMDRDGHY